MGIFKHLVSFLLMFSISITALAATIEEARDKNLLGLETTSSSSPAFLLQTALRLTNSSSSLDGDDSEGKQLFCTPNNCAGICCSLGCCDGDICCSSTTCCDRGYSCCGSRFCCPNSVTECLNGQCVRLSTTTPSGSNQIMATHIPAVLAIITLLLRMRSNLV
jgi:hypothetical protein